MKPNADHHDAELVLKVYEMRREAVMRESRNAMNAKFLPRSFDDLMAVTKFDNPLNAAWRQTSTYWEMVYGMVKHGIVHGEYFMEANGEGLLLYSKVLPYLEEFRKTVSPVAFQNAEFVATNTERGKQLVAVFQKRIAQMLEAQAPK